MNYSFVEELSALPERTLSSQILDWTVFWQGRHRRGVVVTAAAAAATIDQTQQQVALSPFPQSAIDVLVQHNVSCLKIQVFNTAVSLLDETSATAAERRSNSWNQYASAAGLSITATFTIPTTLVSNNNKKKTEQLIQDKFRQLLLRILSERFILGSLESIQNQRLHRFVHVDWQDLKGYHDNVVTRIPVMLMLPHEAFSLSAEGIREFMTHFVPFCQHCGILGVHSPTEWSNLILGQEEPSSTSSKRISSSSSDILTANSWGRRGLWIEIQSEQDNKGDGCGTTNCAYQMDLGLVWRTRTKGSDISWSNLLGDDRQAIEYQKSPLVDSTRWRILDNPQIPVQDKCDDDHDKKKNLQKRCIHAPLNTKFTKSSPANEIFSVQSNIWRTQGPGHGGRMETIFQNQHVSCEARVKIWQIIPPVLRPVWSSFVVSDALTKPERRWKDDGTLELTMDNNVTSNSVLQYAFDYEPMFLSIESFPADPNRGFELPPVRVIVEPQCNVVDEGLPSQINIFSESLLFLSPLPDASMPFNVLSLSCTLFAFVIGSILNLLVRRASEKIKYKLHPELKPKGKLQKIKERVVEKLTALRNKLLPPKKDSEEADQKQKED